MILSAKYEAGVSQVYTKPVFQYSKEVTLLIENCPITLPATVAIANSKEFGNSVEYTVRAVPFKIPDEYFVNGQYVYVWFETGDLQILIVIPIIQKSSPTKASEGGEGGQTYEYDEENESINIIPVGNGLGIEIEMED